MGLTAHSPMVHVGCLPCKGEESIDGEADLLFLGVQLGGVHGNGLVV